MIGRTAVPVFVVGFVSGAGRLRMMIVRLGWRLRTVIVIVAGKMMRRLGWRTVLDRRRRVGFVAMAVVAVIVGIPMPLMPDGINGYDGQVVGSKTVTVIANVAGIKNVFRLATRIHIDLPMSDVRRIVDIQFEATIVGQCGPNDLFGIRGVGNQVVAAANVTVIDQVADDSVATIGQIVCGQLAGRIDDDQQRGGNVPVSGYRRRRLIFLGWFGATRAAQNKGQKQEARGKRTQFH